MLPINEHGINILGNESGIFFLETMTLKISEKVALVFSIFHCVIPVMWPNDHRF